MKSCKEQGGWRRRKSAVRTNFPAPQASPPLQVLHQPSKVAVGASHFYHGLIEYEDVVLPILQPSPPPPRVLRQPPKAAGRRRRKSAVRTNFPAPPPSPPPPQVLHQPLKVAVSASLGYHSLIEYEDVVLKPSLPPSPPPSRVSSTGSNDYSCSPCTSPVMHSPVRSSLLVNFCPPSLIYTPAGPAYDYPPATISSPKYTLKTPEYSPLTPISSPKYTPKTTEYYSPLTPEYSPATPEYSPLTPEYSPAMPEYSPLTPEYSPTTPEYSPLTPEYSPATPEYSPLDYTPSSPIHW